MSSEPVFRPVRALPPPTVWTAPAACAAVGAAVIVSTAPSRSLDGDLVLGFGAPGPAFALVVTVVALAPLALLPRRPLVALGLLLLALSAIPAVLGERGVAVPQVLAVGAAVAHLAATRPRRTSVAASVAAAAVLGAYAAMWPPEGDADVLFVAQLLVLTVLVAWLTGDALRRRRARDEEHRARRTRQAVTAERLRIARDLHDMVAHSIGIIAIQAGVGHRVLDTRPEEARSALKAIEATSREALAGMRRTVTALRAADAADEAEDSVRAPAPGLADLDRLAADSAEAGVRVHFARTGSPGQLPPDIDLSAYRIVQEAVTNVIRHAGTGECRVTVDRTDGELRLEITDDGRGGPAVPGRGFGLAGMRERVALLHGELVVGPRPEGGFRVAARLPLPEEAA
ncbi:sensor histidine kinase [Yinghuangia sp. YIM S09857]|uniref:sensor histidine kinase n=1 Tax=Yinghuangia sp. YIM S09857 TaxID=3436929 RepID=UPI003F52A329